MSQLSEFQKTCDQELIMYLQKKEGELSKVSAEASILIRIISTFIQNGGKRIRPALYYFASTSYGANKEEALKLSLTFELFQTFCLIHDDIIDQSPLRRGQQTVHIKHDIPTAILAGDMALMLADEIFLAEYPSSSVKQIYNTFKQEVLLGEYLDTIFHQDATTVMDLKTARYTFMRPVELGLQHAEVDQHIIDIWKSAMHDIGIAFQLKDDLMGVFGSEDDMGKSPDSDLQEGKYTHLIELFKRHASTSQLEEFNTLFKKKELTHADCDNLRTMLREYDIPSVIQQEITQSIQHTKKKLNAISHVVLHDVAEEILSFIQDMRMIKYSL